MKDGRLNEYICIGGPRIRGSDATLNEPLQHHVTEAICEKIGLYVPQNNTPLGYSIEVSDRILLTVIHE